MEQVIFGGYYDLLRATATEYTTLRGGVNWITTQNVRRQAVSTDGIIKNLRLKLSGAPGAGKKYTFTLMLNGAPTALTFDIADAATSGSNMVNEIDVTGGDTVSLQCVPDGTPTTVYATWSSIFEGDTANESLILGGSWFNLSKTAIEYGQVEGRSNFSVTENNFRQVIPTAGTIENLYVWLHIDPGDPGDAYRFTLRKGTPPGAMGDTALTVTITANDTTGSNLVNAIAVAAGDVLTMKIEPLNTPANAPWPAWGMTFVADVDGESISLGGTTNDLDNAATEHNYLSGRETDSWNANENERYQLGQVCVLKKLHILLSASPGAGNSYTFSLNIVGDSNDVVALVADAATTGDSGVLIDTVALDDYVTLKVVPDDTPNTADAYWGFVCYIAPPAPAGAGMGAKPPIMELLLAGVID